MKVRSMTSNRTGKSVANQFIITGEKGLTEYFQSYKSIIVQRNLDDGKILLDVNKWDYSKTTGKYRNQFLGETKKETERKIKDGTYKLVNLN
jgi:hypothetical protein